MQQDRYLAGGPGDRDVEALGDQVVAYSGLDFVLGIAEGNLTDNPELRQDWR
jgi:hypothetical protein